MEHSAARLPDAPALPRLPLRAVRAPSNHIFDHTPQSLRQWCQQQALEPYRATQILEWVYARRVVAPAEMTNLPRPLRERLAAEMTFLSGEVLEHRTGSDGTQKLLIQWHQAPAGPPDGRRPAGVPLPLLEPPPADPSRQTECVMIPGLDPKGPRRTACVSSQIGCPVGCRFCASGLGGFDGNLSAGRIVEQVWRLNRLLLDQWRVGPAAGVRSPTTRRPPRITHVVFMGMGEPLANFSAVVHAVRTLAAPWGMGISARRITISTVGLPRAIERLAEELDLPITLALSLHAPADDIRRQLIPWSRFTTIRDLLAACQKWFDKTGREITLEYTLLRGVNDRPRQAEQLARLARTLRANVNLIRYNEVDGVPFRRPRGRDVLRFQRILREHHVNARIRASRGRDIAAACGQLRHEHART